jgi:hypothetical protein
VELDLHDFACGHIGLSRVENVAELKRRLGPAIAELEDVGFIARVDSQERYRKVRPGVWRIRFTVGPQFPRRLPTEVSADPAQAPAPAAPVISLPEPETGPRAASETPEAALVIDFYRRWGAEGEPRVGDSDLIQARDLVERYGAATAAALIPDLVQVLKRKWPECKSFSGAVQKYLPEAARAYEQRQRRRESSCRAKEQQQRDREEVDRQSEERRQLEARWQALSEEEHRAIEQVVLRRDPALARHPAMLRLLCLRELARSAPPDNEG